jgi:energy-coupling factor transporter ATP-binding protein EcfA2
MSQPDAPDSNPLAPFVDLLKTIAEQFSKLPVILAFGGLIVILFIVLLSTGRDIPDALIWFTLAVIAFFVIMNVIDRWFNLQEQKIDKPILEPQPSLPVREPAPEPTPETPDYLTPAEMETRYLAEICYRCGWVSTTAFDPKARHAQAKKLHLASVFTDLDVPREGRLGKMVRPEVPAREGELNRRRLAEMEKEMRQSALLSLSRHPRLVLLGKPGSGKSTLVNYLALCLAGEKLGETNFNLARLVHKGWELPGLLPLRVVLRDYAARGLPAGQSLWQFLCGELARIKDGRNGTLAPYAPHLEKTLKEKGGLLLLDGYDEVPEAHRRREQLQEAIVEFQHHFSRVRILVTSRPYAYEDVAWQLPGFARTELLDFGSDQINHYIEQWYKAMAEADPNLTKEQADAFTEQLQAEIKENPNLRDLAPRPLLLALMTLLHRSRSGARLPQERHQLYEESVDLLLDFWEQPKRTYDAQLVIRLSRIIQKPSDRRIVL